jgi:hypothetical protein
MRTGKKRQGEKGVRKKEKMSVGTEGRFFIGQRTRSVPDSVQARGQKDLSARRKTQLMRGSTSAHPNLEENKTAGPVGIR